MHNLLLPNKYKRLGWYLFVPAAVFGLILLLITEGKMPINAKVFAVINTEPLSTTQHFSFVHTDVSDTIVGILFILGGLLIGFSKEKNEDEYIASLRLTSLLWAVLVNYVLLLLCFVFIFGMAFLDVMVYNMFTVLIIFIGRFNYVLYRNAKSSPNEKFH